MGPFDQREDVLRFVNAVFNVIGVECKHRWIGSPPHWTLRVYVPPHVDKNDARRKLVRYAELFDLLRRGP